MNISTLRLKLSEQWDNPIFLKKMAVVFIVIGILIPSVLYLLSEPTSNAQYKQITFAANGVSYEIPFNEYELVLYSGNIVYGPNVRYGERTKTLKNRTAITFNYILVFGILSLSTGILLYYRHSKLNEN